MKALRQMFGILAVMAVVGTVYNFANFGNSTIHLPWVRADPTPVPDSRFPMIGTEETFEELQAESLIIDARRTKAYEEGHIPGALSISPWEADVFDKIAKLVEEGAVLEAPVVIYCNDSRECEDSKLAADKLKAAGFLDLKIYQGGFPTWKKEKPTLIVKGNEPGALTP